MNAANNTAAAKGIYTQVTIKNYISSIKDGLKEFYDSYIKYEEKENALGLTPEMQSRLYL